jgi:hypothetical protein
MSEPHDVVKLLVARMESHPEEFSLNSRWYEIIGEIRTWGNEADKAAIDVSLREIRLKEAHEDAMDELLNGPDRRRKEAEEAEYELKMIRQQAQQVLRNTTQTAGTFIPGLPATKIGNF